MRREGTGEQHWGGGNSAVGGVVAIVEGGVKSGGSSNSKDRPSHHKYKSPNNWTAQTALNARWAIPVYPVFEIEKSKASDKKSVKQKIA